MRDLPDDPYGPERGQTRAKHELLRAYLKPFAYKTLQTFGSLDFIDGFAGPWRSQNEDFSDTSFGIAVETLAEVQKNLSEGGSSPPIRCLFNEADRSAFERLSAFVDEARVRYPQMKFVATHGEFSANAVGLAAAASNKFRLVFIDPTGWTGYPREALVELLKHPHSEVIINFMASFIDRFFREPEERRTVWLEQLLGVEGAESLRQESAREEDVRRAIANMLREDLSFKYICESPIAKNEVNQVHFWMLYGTRSPVGVEVLRDAEVAALTKHERTREQHRQGAQQVLAGLPVPGPYSNMRERHLRELEMLICDLVAKTPNPVSFGVLATRIMTRCYLRKSEIKDASVSLSKRNLLVPTWKSRSSRVRKPGDEDMMILVES